MASDTNLQSSTIEGPAERDTATATGHTTHHAGDPAIGAGLGLIGGAVVGAVAGGPLGAVIGGAIGAVAGDLGVAAVEHAGQGSSGANSESAAFDNSGASTPDYDASTGVTRGDDTIGDIHATDHITFGVSRGEVIDDSAPIGKYRASSNNDRAIEDGSDGPA